MYIPEGGALSLDGCGQNVATTIAATGSTGRQKRERHIIGERVTGEQ